MTAHPKPSVTQADRDAAARVWSWIKILSPEQGEEILLGEWDETHIVQAFARHRLATEAASRAREDALAAEVERLRGALASARKIIRDVEDYMARPDRGDWGVECALCMGELFDDDRDAIAVIDAALSASDGEGV